MGNRRTDTAGIVTGEDSQSSGKVAEMNTASVSTRFAFSVAANAAKALVSFFTGIIVARGLEPLHYGELTFLMGSFVAVRSLLDMGTSSAYFTFIAQGKRQKYYHYIYFLWLALQFILVSCSVGFILPGSLIEHVWLGHERSAIFMAFFACFMQQQVWNTVVQINEASRATIKIQTLAFSIASLHLVIIAILYFVGTITIKLVLSVIIVEYIIAAYLAFALKRDSGIRHAIRLPVAESKMRYALAEYWTYCKPLALLSFLSFVYEFGDRWLLQRFGGAPQQGFYQIASQFSAIGLLATTSILNIFWKEIAEASQKDPERARLLYSRISRGLLMLGSTIACALIPWSQQIVRLLLGENYAAAWPVFAVMLFYTIHQSIGQINATVFMATGQTGAYFKVSAFGMLISIPVAILVLAPNNGTLLSGLGLGAIGLAAKMAGLNVLLVNLQAWLVARHFGWRFEWEYQFVVVGFPLVISFAMKELVCSASVSACDASGAANVILPIMFSSFLYLTSICGVVWLYPGLLLMDRARISSAVTSLSRLRRWR